LFVVEVYIISQWAIVVKRFVSHRVWDADFEY
jgi:hypothetical protein